MSDILIPSLPFSENKFRALLDANSIYQTLSNPLRVARTFNSQLWIGNIWHYDIQTNLFSVIYSDSDEEELNLH